MTLIASILVFSDLVPYTYFNSVHHEKSCFFLHVVYANSLSKRSEEEKDFTFPRTKEEFVLWGGNMTLFLTLTL